MTPKTRKVRETARKGLTLEQIEAERERLGIPPDAMGQRNWLRFMLNQKGWSQARIGRTVKASESSVSVIYRGERTTGSKSNSVRALTAEVLGIPEAVLFPQAARDQMRKDEEARVREAEEEKYRQAIWHRK